MTALMIALGAAIGAPSRYLTDRYVQSRLATAFPWGTLTVNLIAGLILGVITSVSHRVDADLVALIGPGFCATLSTYSTFSYETVRLFETGNRGYAVAYPALSIVAGIGAAAAGWSLGMAL
jgi:CrcB protein